MRIIKISKRFISLLLSLLSVILITGLLLTTMVTAVNADVFPIKIGGTDIADIWIQSAAVNNGQINIPYSSDEIEDGAVLADKSVTYYENGAFDVTLSATGRRIDMTQEEYFIRNKPINVVFLLDTSGSMGDIDLDAMMTAAKEAGKMILDTNANNNAAIVYFDQSARLADNSWTWANQNNIAATLDTLTRPDRVNWTNITAGLNRAAYLLNSDDAPNRDNANRIIILMSDGAPNRYSSSDTDWGAGIQGSGTVTGDTVSVRETIKRASEISHSGIDIYTVGYNVSDNNLAWITLNPNNGPNRIYGNVAVMDVTASWRDNGTTLRFRADNTAPNVDIPNALNGMTATASEAEIYYKYNKAYYTSLDPAHLVESFKDFVNDITVDAASPVKTEIIITDTIGEGFELAEPIENIQARAAEIGTHAYYDGQTLTWIIPAARLNLIDPKGWSGNVTAGNITRPVDHIIDPNTLTFRIKPLDGIEPSGDEPEEFFTNEQADWEFDKSDENTFSGETGGKLINTGKIVIVKEKKYEYKVNYWFEEYDDGTHMYEKDGVIKSYGLHDFSYTEKNVPHGETAFYRPFDLTVMPGYIFYYVTGGVNEPVINSDLVINIYYIKVFYVKIDEPDEIPATTNPPIPTVPPVPPIPPLLPILPIPSVPPLPLIPPAATEPKPVIPEEALEEALEEDLIPLTDGYFALPIQNKENEKNEKTENDLYKIFDDSGTPLGIVQIPANEDIGEYFDFDNIIPLDDFILSNGGNFIITDIITERDNPKTGDTNKFLVMPVILLTAAAIIGWRRVYYSSPVKNKE